MASTNTSVLPISKGTLPSGWHSTLRYTGCYPAITSFHHSLFPPLRTSRGDTDDGKCWNFLNRNAPSQPQLPPTPPVTPMYPFQCICSDYFDHAGYHYLVTVDIYYYWPVVERISKGGSKTLIISLRRLFSTYLMNLPQTEAQNLLHRTLRASYLTGKSIIVTLAYPTAIVVQSLV